ncbi:cell division protein ZapA [Psychromonas sp. PRT-SC03]|nr:cell division protein ZapA [Psychromonas sp. PRT-SC03]
MANIEISILGQQYKIACPEGEEKALQQTVEQFNLKLNNMKSNTRSLRNEQLIVMVALNLCHELNNEKEKNQKQTQELNQRIKALHQSIVSALQPSEK